MTERTGQQWHYRAFADGTTHIVLEPVDSLARLAALVPPLCGYT